MTGQVNQYQVSLRCKSADYRIPRLPSMAEAVQENQRGPSPNTLVNQPHTSCFTPLATLHNSSICGGGVIVQESGQPAAATASYATALVQTGARPRQASASTDNALCPVSTQA
jgi:hypothetical protein